MASSKDQNTFKDGLTNIKVAENVHNLKEVWILKKPNVRCARIASNQDENDPMFQEFKSDIVVSNVNQQKRSPFYIPPIEESSLVQNSERKM